MCVCLHGEGTWGLYRDNKGQRYMPHLTPWAPRRLWWQNDLTYRQHFYWSDYMFVSASICFELYFCHRTVLPSTSMLLKSYRWGYHTTKYLPFRYFNFIPFIPHRVLISNNCHNFPWDAITHPCPNFHISLTKLSLNLGHRWQLLVTILYGC